ncbi:cysteine desulfurase-like protein [Salinivibrio costicola]|uniref:Cysteine desulfurase-like protein n=1 Tax=Salinivibrio costicola subsp. alcaliphilus TaxID=272773 RepID=A0ABX3KR15_SALCS|nr:cysteine desulfurase-like protein [Salinivibrio costicola]OOF33581.1 cysteine desulfurase-like protein [Salinivibrio costicola subsp. alcaliphilus]
MIPAVFSPHAVRGHFPALTQTIDGQSVAFFDGPGGAQVPQSVLDAMVTYLGHYNANLGGQFFSGHHTTAMMQQARESAAAFVNASSSDCMVFGPNMTTLTFSLSRAISRDWQAGDEVIVSALDHYSNVSSWQQAAHDKGATVKQVRVDESNYSIDMTHLASLITDKTKLIAVTLASNTTGSLVDVANVVEMARKVGAKVYVDAVHYAPHYLVDVQALGCDFLACSAYKFFGPHLGFVYVAPEWVQTLKPYKVEPATNQGPGRFETGTQSFEAIAGFIAVVEYLAQWGDPDCSLRERLAQSYRQYQAHEQQLSAHFIDLMQAYPNVHIYGVTDDDQLAYRTPTFAIRIEGVTPADVAQALGKQHFCVWNGHFYSQGLCEQLDILDKGGVIRIGMMHYNTVDEIDRLHQALLPFISD